jgi:hypothetical protein
MPTILRTGIVTAEDIEAVRGTKVAMDPYSTGAGLVGGKNGGVSGEKIGRKRRWKRGF